MRHWDFLRVSFISPSNSQGHDAVRHLQKEEKKRAKTLFFFLRPDRPLSIARGRLDFQVHSFFSAPFAASPKALGAKKKLELEREISFLHHLSTSPKRSRRSFQSYCLRSLSFSSSVFLFEMRDERYRIRQGRIFSWLLCNQPDFGIRKISGNFFFFLQLFWPLLPTKESPNGCPEAHSPFFSPLLFHQ